MKSYNNLKLYWIFIIIWIFSGCTKSSNSQEISDNDNKNLKCYLVARTDTNSDSDFFENLSRSVISKYVVKVDSMPTAGISEKNCIIEISLEKRNLETFVTINSKDINGYGVSQLKGNDAIQQSLLKAIYNSIEEKRGVICRDFGELLDECDKDNLIASREKTVIGVMYREADILRWKRSGKKWFHKGNKLMIKFEGELRNGVPSGFGKESMPNGEVFEGSYINGFRKEGTHDFPSGAFYVGKFEGRLPNGYGTLISKNGRKYVGNFLDGFYSGQGSMFFPDGSNYIGEFKENTYYGKGTLTSKTGTKFIGTWKNSKPWKVDVHDINGQKFLNMYVNGVMQD